MKIGPLSWSLVMIVLFFIVAFIGTSQACSNLTWRLYKAKFHKSYETHDEELKRSSIFCDNVKKITEHNERYHQGVETWEMGLNQFADWTQKEFHDWLIGEKDVL